MNSPETSPRRSGFASARALLLAPLLAGLAAACTEAPPPPAPLEGARLGGPFSLTDETGRPVTDQNFKGRWTLVYFGYTYCPDVCPVDAAKLMAGLKLYEKDQPELAAKIQPLFITVDPERDTPDILRQFTDRYHPRLLGLRGTEQQLADVARAYAISYKKQPPPPGGDPQSYLVGHTQLAFLMDPDGKPVALVSIDDPTTEADEGAPAKVAQELATYVR